MKLSDARRIFDFWPGSRRAEPARLHPKLRGRLRRDPGLAGELAQKEMTPQVRSAVMRLMAELDQVKSELGAARDRVSELEDLADEDPLVPVLNRRGFVRELDRTLAYVTRYGTEASLVYLDVDAFKQINDAHGHAAGDALLKRVGALLVANVRKSDIVGRLGGDEFAVVLHRAPLESAEMKARQLEDLAAQECLTFAGARLPLGLSAGVTQLQADDTVEQVLTQADEAMYARKLQRRGTDTAGG